METFVGDTVQFSLSTGIDVSGYTSLLIKYKKPDGAKGYWTAAVDPADNTVMNYTCLETDLDMTGEWLLQAFVESVGAQLHGTVNKLIVHNMIASLTTAAPTTAAP